MSLDASWLEWYALVCLLAVALTGCASNGETKQTAARENLEGIARQAAKAYAEERWEDAGKLYRTIAERDTATLRLSLEALR